MKSASGDDRNTSNEKNDGDAHYLSQSNSRRASERERARKGTGEGGKRKKETIVTADKSSCLHISIPSMYNITIKHQQ